jgi:catechol 2,3-dioxygenase-like lactoylglutathione lyase family enzyme
MPLSHGCNHVTVVTNDIDRLVAFYEQNFEADIKLDMTEGVLRHALIDMGNGFCLHPFQLLSGENANAEGLPGLFDRGHIDHIAINFESQEKFEMVQRRLVREGVTTGRVRDFGSVRIMSFRDPDGMECELALWKDGKPLKLDESRLEELAEA